MSSHPIITPDLENALDSTPVFFLVEYLAQRCKNDKVELIKLCRIVLRLQSHPLPDITISADDVKESLNTHHSWINDDAP